MATTLPESGSLATVVVVDEAEVVVCVVEDSVVDELSEVEVDHVLLHPVRSSALNARAMIIGRRCIASESNGKWPEAGCIHD